MNNSVELRDAIETDLPLFYEQQLDPEAIRMAAFPTRGKDAFMTHWSKIIIDHSVLTKTILFQGDVAGNIVCFEQLGEHEVGYWLGKEYWGKGIASTALAQFLEFIETRPLYAHVAKHNIASKRVLEKCGFNVAAEDTFFSKIFGEDIEEYILVLDSPESANTDDFLS
jgi:RimJ/RimL family protein N-acetyltransferase